MSDKLEEVTLVKPCTHKGENYLEEISDGVYGKVKVTPKQKAVMQGHGIVAQTKGVN